MPPLRATPRYRPAATSSRREFVDRREAIALFRRALNERRPDEQRVINYFGVGGIGKSRLQQELRRIVAAEPGALSVRADLQAPSLRRHDAVLAHLRHCLAAEHKIQMPMFDIAYSVYWQRVNPNVPLNGGELALLGESEILADLVDVAGDTPVFGFVVSLISGLDKLGRRTKRWQRVRSDEDLLRLEDLDTDEMLDALTWFFARDLQAALKSSHRAVMFVDAHEALWEDVTARGGRGSRDAWLRDLAGQTSGVLWIVCSRDALRWAEDDDGWVEPYLTHYGLDDLPSDDRMAFLSGCGIDGPLAEAISSASEGVPFYLNVSVDHWDAIRQTREPTVEDFGASKHDLVSRFVGHVPQAEQDLLRILSVTRSWDRLLFEALIKRFNVAFPLVRWDDLCRYSFTRATTGERWLMHQLMRHELTRRMHDELRVDIHTAIFEFERDRADDSSLPIDTRAEALREALLHSVPARALEPDWFLRTVEFFMLRGRWNVLAPAIDELEASFDGGKVSPELIALRDFVEAWILRQKGRLRAAADAFDELDRELLTRWDDTVGFQIANVRRESGDISGAGAIYERLWAGGSARERREVHLLIGVQLADFHYVQGRFRTAAQILDELLELDDRQNARVVAEALRIMGHIERFNERPGRGLARYRHAGELFVTCDDVFGAAMIQTNLAEALWVSDPAAAVRAGLRGVEDNEALGARLEAGKALVATAYGYLLLGDVRQAEETVVAARSMQLEVGYAAGAAQALLCRGWVRLSSGDCSAAIDDIATAAQQFAELAAYPTLQHACHSALSVLAPERTSAQAVPVIAWLDTDGHVPLDRLVGRLLRV